MKKLVCVFLTLGLLLAAPAAQALVPPGGPLPDLSLPDEAGQKHLLRELAAGKVVLLVYWSVTCPVCVKELPEVRRLAAKFEGNPFRLLMISGDAPAMIPAVGAFAGQEKLPRPWLFDLGPGDAMPAGDALGVEATPSIFVVNRQGKIVFTGAGHVDLSKVEKALEAAF